MRSRSPPYLQTSEVMKAANVGRETLRFYEKRGLIPKALRTDSGYRQYTRDTVELIIFIKVPCFLA
jgi:Predicted transcriptional regulators